MKIILTRCAEEDLDYWRQNNPKKIERIKQLLTNIKSCPYSGIGKPEALKHNWSGYWSRRIDRENRLIYRVTDEGIEVIQCRFHY